MITSTLFQLLISRFESVSIEHFKYLVNELFGGNIEFYIILYNRK